MTKGLVITHFTKGVNNLIATNNFDTFRYTLDLNKDGEEL